MAYCVKINCYRTGYNCLINHVTIALQVFVFLGWLVWCSAIFPQLAVSTVDRVEHGREPLDEIATLNHYCVLRPSPKLEHARGHGSELDLAPKIFIPSPLA